MYGAFVQHAIPCIEPLEGDTQRAMHGTGAGSRAPPGDMMCGTCSRSCANHTGSGQGVTSAGGAGRSISNLTSNVLSAAATVSCSCGRSNRRRLQAGEAFQPAAQRRVGGQVQHSSTHQEGEEATRGAVLQGAEGLGIPHIVTGLGSRTEFIRCLDPKRAVFDQRRSNVARAQIRDDVNLTAGMYI